MANRNLARTIVQGGHPNWYKHAIAFLRRKERQRTRRFCHKMTQDPDLWDEQATPLLEKSGWWDDKHDHFAACISKWLKSQNGRRWDDVYSELTARYDTRKVRNYVLVQTIARMICFGCHWCEGDKPCFGAFVKDGILKCSPRSWRRRYKTHQPQISNEMLKAWIGSRAVKVSGKELFWMELTEGSERETREVYHSCGQRRCYSIKKDFLIGHYRQGRKFSKAEVAFWSTLNERQKLWCQKRNPHFQQ